MGIVWEAYHKGVPLLGVPENPIENLPSLRMFLQLLHRVADWCSAHHACESYTGIYLSLPILSQNILSYVILSIVSILSMLSSIYSI